MTKTNLPIEFSPGITPYKTQQLRRLLAPISRLYPGVGFTVQASPSSDQRGAIAVTVSPRDRFVPHGQASVILGLELNRLGLKAADVKFVRQSLGWVKGKSLPGRPDHPVTTSAVARRNLNADLAFQQHISVNNYFERAKATSTITGLPTRIMPRLEQAASDTQQFLNGLKSPDFMDALIEILNNHIASNKGDYIRGDYFRNQRQEQIERLEDIVFKLGGSQ